MELTTLLFLGLAVLIAFKLRSVLGQRTGTERPPFDPVARRDGTPNSAAGNDKVVQLPQRGGPRPAEQQPLPPLPPEISPNAAAATPLGLALQQIMRADRSFNADQFLWGAKQAYEMIVMAFSAGDRASLKPLLSKEVFDGFEGAIAERERAGQKVETTFVGMDGAEIVEAAMRGQTAQVTVKFTSKLIQATRDAAGAVVAGDATKVAEVVDVWTFAREITARDPNWRLIATEEAA